MQNKALYTAASLLMLAGSAPLLAAAPGNVEVKDLNISRADKRILVEMNLDASKLRMSTNRETRYTPMLVNGGDTLRMPAFSVAGKNRFYSVVRSGADEEMLYRAGKIKKAIPYKYTGEWLPWMSTAKLVVEKTDCGCCGKRVGENGTTDLATLDFEPKPFRPDIAAAYVTPEAEAVKIRQISARAYVDFPVNQVKIYPDYRRNPQELAKIKATIDSVRADKNLSITGIAIQGFASPEGSYASNAKLAQGRTETLAEYVRGLYKMNRSQFSTSSTPEDWAGLREFVASPEGAKVLSNQQALLELLDNPAYNGRDDEREAVLKTRFPADYKYLLANVYPGLRHSDYAVKFNVRTFTEPEEIIKIMKTSPKNLSLQELFVAAKSQKPGSPLYNEAFEIAVRMYPEDPAANLNAGCAALQRGDLEQAERYLDKAGKSPEAQYARAILTAMEGNNAGALKMLQKLKPTPAVKSAIDQLTTILDTNGSKFRQVSDTL